MNVDFNKIESKYFILIEKAISYMKQIDDFEHNVKHVYDVVYYTKELINSIDVKIDIEVCILSAYWHDVGRLFTAKNHELKSATMLKEEMEKLYYDELFIDKCYKAIINHRWDMHPDSLEGLLIKDADKLAWLGIERWSECLKNKCWLDDIVSLLPKLRNDILYFEESRKIFDRDITAIFTMLYDSLKREACDN